MPLCGMLAALAPLMAVVALARVSLAAPTPETSFVSSCADCPAESFCEFGHPSAPPGLLACIDYRTSRRLYRDYAGPSEPLGCPLVVPAAGYFALSTGIGATSSKVSIAQTGGSADGTTWSAIYNETSLQLTNPSTGAIITYGSPDGSLPFRAGLQFIFAQSLFSDTAPPGNENGSPRAYRYDTVGTSIESAPLGFSICLPNLDGGFPPTTFTRYDLFQYAIIAGSAIVNSIAPSGVYSAKATYNNTTPDGEVLVFGFSAVIRWGSGIATWTHSGNLVLTGSGFSINVRMNGGSTSAWPL
ncbi:hypothetical protein DFJ74DRAFT_296507 [Hyaloraphidium curvatum]|nr:hypothetical protein DFJ74DRAFT_296507 [Hyaloraphidium curvatum]